MPLFWFHDSKGLSTVISSGAACRYAGLHGDSEPGGRHHHPLNPLNPMNPHTEGVSKGKKPK